MIGLPYEIPFLAEIIGAEAWHLTPEGHGPVRSVSFDSRELNSASGTLFVAIRSEGRDGHRYMEHAFREGARRFLVEDESLVPAGASWIRVKDTVAALQLWAAWHRKQFDIPVVAITGSNGKTIVKEWLSTLLESRYQVVKSPRSYNSRIGVPLSLLQIKPGDEIALIEAGISRMGEMRVLKEMIRPGTGIMTHFGDAHQEGFSSERQKLEEKLSLFADTEAVMLTSDDAFVQDAARARGLHLRTVGRDASADVRIVDAVPLAEGWEVKGEEKGMPFAFKVPVAGDAALENACLCWLAARHFGVAPLEIATAFARIHPVSMRTELITDNPEITILNDAYNADLASIGNAFSLLASHHAQPHRRVVMSDLDHQGRMQEQVQEQVLKDAIQRFGTANVTTVGPVFFRLAKEHPGISAYADVEALIAGFSIEEFRRSTVLLKGSRNAHLEKLIPFLSRRVNATHFRINLNHLAGNLRTFRRLAGHDVKIMAMVKAFSYGSGSWEIAQALEKEGADHFAVAYLSEGIELRARGIRHPIMVMNPDEGGFDQLFHFNLEPEVFRFPSLRRIAEEAARFGRERFGIHLKVDTGMHRLGFSLGDVEDIAGWLNANPRIRVQSVFSHLAAADDPSMDALTHRQAAEFMNFWQGLSDRIGYRPMRHLLNTAGVVRFPEYAFEMIRPGIGLYGINPSPVHVEGLNEIGSLHSVVSQVQEWVAGTGIGYGHSQVVTRDSRIATIPVGYADGIPRRLGNGRISFLLHGKPAPTVGRICMDMLMLDVTDIPGVREADEVVLFGEQGGAFLSVNALAHAAETIPYEILAGLSQRVRRVWVKE